MTAHNDWVSIFDYLQVNNNFNEQNFAIIRERYQVQCGGLFPEIFDESSIDEVARQLRIKIDTTESRELLHDCVLTAKIEDSQTLVKAILGAKIVLPNITSFTLKHIVCVLTVKTNLSKLANFLSSFLFKAIHGSSNWNIDQKMFVLNNQCPLYLFIQEQVREQGTLTSIININDDFGPWYHDRWHGLFDLKLESHDNRVSLPKKCCLANDVQIHCRIEICSSNENLSMSSHLDIPRTSNLEMFVEDVCKREHIDQNESWLEALRNEDIFSFEHLCSLTQSEWDRMRKISVLARKALKAAVDQARTSMTGEQRQQVIEQSESIVTVSVENSELLANLHLIKLFIWHKLRHHPAVQRYGALAKLEMKCLDLAFEEMQADGFADDGLFARIREFFLPFTISEQELHLKRSANQGVRLALHRQLQEQINFHTNECDRNIKAKEKCDDDIIQIENLIKAHEQKCSQASIEWKSSDNKKKQKKQLEALYRIYIESLKTHANLLEQRNQQKQKKDEISKKINEHQTQIDTTKVRIQMIEIDLRTPHKPVDTKLVKPPRGLIMYGPPGTGKSEILKRLAQKLGILMVGPPLAAGELNRSLVGQSEQIIIALCSRCYQVPYAMCCVSIDEIDSLAPKRDKDSSEGKVDKISVLLSLIDGIKDVPNLMILSATNRLHMMDEAFLRRMSGKFFVGRPSSDARLTMLRKIPCWAIEPELLDRLTMATTNFSGAAVTALTKAITAKCIERQRYNSNYQIGKIEALKIVDRIAQQYQIFIGSETLPSLLLRNPSTHMYHLQENYKYTGRIIVDLYQKNIRIEILNHNQPSILVQDLYSNETTVQTLLERLTDYGKCRNVQLLQLIDLNLLASQNAYDQNKVYETLKDRSDECVSYPRSMIVYDLDALVGVNKTESNSNMGMSISSAMHNPSIYVYILSRFRDRIMEDIQNIERWTVAIIREPFLLRQFSDDVQYPRTSQEEEELKQEKRNATQRFKCVKCKDFYVQDENKMGSCVHHDGFLYNIEEIYLDKYTPSQVATLFRELERKMIKYPNQREELEQETRKYRWICCDEIFTNVRIGGCKRGKHGNGSTDRLTQTIIQEWEESCRKNEEYHEKWFMLASEQ